MTKQLISASCDQQGRAAFQRDHPCPQITHHPRRHGPRRIRKARRLGATGRRTAAGPRTIMPWRRRRPLAATAAGENEQRRCCSTSLRVEAPFPTSIPASRSASARSCVSAPFKAWERQSVSQMPTAPAVPFVLTGKPVGTDVAIMRKIIQTAIPPGIRAQIRPAQQHVGDSRDRERPCYRPGGRA